MQLGLIGNGAHPETGEPVAYRLDDSLREATEHGDASRLGDLMTVKEAIKPPHRVFRDSDGTYTLVAKPRKRYRDPATATQAPYYGIFLVHIDRGMTIFDFGWVDLSLEFPGLSVEEAERRFLSGTFGDEVKND
ncbi:MAG: hypothetical protein IT458_19765 [Planctomycetes bacterium]|nr:hypothetical protein [Planctomycetota bacterium]